MIRQYHRWTRPELDRVVEYVARMDHPLSPYDIHDFAEELGLSSDSVRGAVQREMKRIKNESVS